MFGKGIYYVRSECKYNGVTYNEVMPVKFDPSNPEYIICVKTNFGSEQSILKDRIFRVTEHAVSWDDIELFEVSDTDTDTEE